MPLAAWGFCEKRHKNAVLENTTFSSGPGQKRRVGAGAERREPGPSPRLWSPVAPSSVHRARPPARPHGAQRADAPSRPHPQKAMRGVTGGAGRPGRC